jgi:hypothetical protein
MKNVADLNLVSSNRVVLTLGVQQMPFGDFQGVVLVIAGIDLEEFSFPSRTVPKGVNGLKLVTGSEDVISNLKIFHCDFASVTNLN